MMTDTDRQRLAAILGMLGSNSAGERDNAARQAEVFRRKHGLMWEELLAVPLEKPIPEPPPAAAPTPEPPRWATKRNIMGMTVPLVIYGGITLLAIIMH